jgi:hypothetical protein
VAERPQQFRSPLSYGSSERSSLGSRASSVPKLALRRRSRRTYAPPVSKLIVSVDWSDVHEGNLDELRVAMKELAEFVDANEARPLAYEVYFSNDGTRMTVLQVHPDPESMEHHMLVAAEGFARVKDLLSLAAIDLYGTPSATLLEQLRQKAELLGGATLRVHELHAGFTRFDSHRS